MKNFITTISIALNVILVVTFLFFYNSFKIINDLADVKSTVTSHPISDDVALNVIFGKIDSNFNLILTTITVLFGLFALLTFFGVKEQFGFQLRAVKRKLRAEKTSWAEYKTDLLSVKGDLSFEVADKISKDLTVQLDKNDKEYKDYVSIIEDSLVCCDYFSQSLIYKKDIYPKFKTSVSVRIKKTLSNTVGLLSSTTIDKIELDYLGYERFLRLQENIHKVADLEDKQNLAFIFSKLSFPTLD